jgi:hypothetical protein
VRVTFVIFLAAVLAIAASWGAAASAVGIPPALRCGAATCSYAAKGGPLTLRFGTSEMTCAATRGSGQFSSRTTGAATFRFLRCREQVTPFRFGIVLPRISFMISSVPPPMGPRRASRTVRSMPAPRPLLGPQHPQPQQRLRRRSRQRLLPPRLRLRRLLGRPRQRHLHHGPGRRRLPRRPRPRPPLRRSRSRPALRRPRLRLLQRPARPRQVPPLQRRPAALTHRFPDLSSPPSALRERSAGARHFQLKRQRPSRNPNVPVS